MSVPASSNTTCRASPAAFEASPEGEVASALPAADGSARQLIRNAWRRDRVGLTTRRAFRLSSQNVNSRKLAIEVGDVFAARGERTPPVTGKVRRPTHGLGCNNAGLPR